MSVSLLSAPDPLALTKGGRLRYQFQGSGRYQTGGTPARTVLKFSTAVPAGTTLTVQWNGQKWPLVARTNPVEANEFPAGDGSSGYAVTLAEFFQTYFPFREDFDVHGSDFGAYRGIVFIAKQPGPQYNISLVDTSSSTLPIPKPITADVVLSGADPIIRERYSVYVELWLQQPGVNTFQRVGKGTLIECDDSGLADYNAGADLHPLLAADLPDFQQNLPTRGIQSHRPYYIAYGEAYGSPIRVGKIVTDTVRHAYLGGVDFEHQAQLGFSLIGFSQRIQPPEDRALRFGNLMRYVRPDQPEWLTFLNSRDATQQAVLRLRLTFDNGTGLTVTNAVDPLPFALGDKLQFGVGPQQLTLAQYVPNGRSLQEYEVRLMVAGADPDGNNYLSVGYRYVLNYSYEPYVRHFAFLTSLGTVDTLTTYGKGTSELTRFYEQAQKSLPAGYDPTDAQFVDYDLALQQQVEVTTGFRDQAELLRWNDFYRSPLRFRIDGSQATPGRALQIGITSKSIKQAKDDDRQFAHKFEYVYLHKDEFYSDDLEPAGDPAPPLSLNVAGTPAVTLQTGPVVNAVDSTVPAAVRELTAADVVALHQLKAAGLHTAAGYLNQASGDELYFPKTQKIDFAQDLKNLPTTRNGYGLSDVLTKAETHLNTQDLIKKLVGIKLHLSSWTGEVEPS